MVENPSKPPEPEAPRAADPAAEDPMGQPTGPGAGDRTDRGLTDFVRRAVSAGVGAAARSKDDIMRVAATEVRSWLDHMDFNNEVLKALSKMVIEVKTEI